MEFKPSEIAIIVIALAIPIAGFSLLFIPGGLNGVFGFAMNPEMRPYVFYGGAVIVFVILAWRIYRRMRPRQRKPDR
jgi:membrane protein implicated in regulation of membrane protease activity